MSGQNNYLGTVISQEMIENEMGYRGSKSEFIKLIPQPKLINSVKEQRVDGGYCIKAMQLRCTLTGFERNYHIKVLSKQLNIPFFDKYPILEIKSNMNQNRIF